MSIREHRVRRRVSKKRENISGGLILLAIGGFLLARQVGAELPFWLFTWPMILIIVGLFVGVKTQFRDFGWLVVVGIGVFFLIDKTQVDVSIRKFIWPGVIIGAGLLILFSGLFRRPESHTIDDSVDAGDQLSEDAAPGATREEIMEVISIFGNTTRVVLSKNFKGGEVITVFGSSQINLTNADFTGKLVLEVIQVFGGTKLIIPPHWEVQAQTATIFGGIEDKRSIPRTGEPEKILVLDGVTFFGGVTISSY
jgi:predicted membrane protein